MDEWISKLWCKHTRENCAALKGNEILTYAITWMSLENIMLSKIRHSQKANTV